MADGWTLNIEREDVCPVIRLPEGADLDGFLATLGKKERHEIRRKVRRAEAAGPVELVESTDPLADLDAFIDLHQARWGERGLFPPTPGGDQGRRFIRRLFELFGAATATDAPTAGHPTIHLGFLTVDGKRIAAEIHFETAGSVLYYNAGVDPDARDLSPGVVLLERLVRRAIERGKCRVDLLRGDEPYKYEWGGVDEPIQRILVRRVGGRLIGPRIQNPVVAACRRPRCAVDPCFEPVMRLPLPSSRHRIRVVELLATGTSGGAQEHVYNLVTRLDRERYDVSVLVAVGRRRRPPAREDGRLGVRPRRHVRRRGDRGGRGAPRRRQGRRRPQPHVSRRGRRHAGRVGARGGRAPPAARRRDGPLEPRSLRGGPRPGPPADAADGPPDRRLARHRPQDRGRGPRRRADQPHLQRRRPRPLRRAGGVLHAPRRVRHPGGAPIVGVVARLEPEKGHPTLLEAWPAVLEAVPNAHLLIVGEGTERDGARGARDRGLGITASVTFTGRRDDVPAVTAALDVAVLPSYREAQGLSILEAMALSRPVVASAVGGIPEMIEHGRTGLLVPPRDPAALAASLVRLLTDHPYADTLARAGHDLVYERFCVELMVRAVETIYDESVADERRLAVG